MRYYDSVPSLLGQECNQVIVKPTKKPMNCNLDPVSGWLIKINIDVFRR